MTEVSLYPNDVVDIAITADLLDRSFSDNESLFFHHTTDNKSWDSAFAAVTYSALDQADADANAGTTGQSGDTEGTLHRYKHTGGVVDVSAADLDLQSEVKQAVNYYMMTKESEATASINLSSSTLVALDGANSGEYANYATWANMISGSTTAGVTNGDIENLIEGLGSDGKLKEGTDLSLHAENVASGITLNLYVVYKITITEADAEEDHVQPRRTFAFLGGASSDGTPIASCADTDTDSSSAPKTGEIGTIRFRTLYTADGTATL